MTNTALHQQMDRDGLHWFGPLSLTEWQALALILVEAGRDDIFFSLVDHFGISDEQLISDDI